QIIKFLVGGHENDSASAIEILKASITLKIWLDTDRFISFEVQLSTKFEGERVARIIAACLKSHAKNHRFPRLLPFFQFLDYLHRHSFIYFESRRDQVQERYSIDQ